MTIRSYAKINLGLQITGRRDDGFHDIDTVFHRIDMFDTIELSRTPRNITLQCNLPYIPTDGRNLCVRAAREVIERSGYDGGVHINLHKRIPVGAGLGGGSSNAAAILQQLPEFLDVQFDHDTRLNIAASLGSDIPYFLRSGSAYASGRGEVLTYFDLEVPYWIVTVYPGVHISTAWAYANLILDPDRTVEDLRSVLQHSMNDPAELRARIRNDFEALVLSKQPRVSNVRDEMITAGAGFVLMSGSGSSMFALFADAGKAEEFTFSMKRMHPTSLTRPGFDSEIQGAPLIGG